VGCRYIRTVDRVEVDGEDATPVYYEPWSLGIYRPTM
jgi:hypothetical protein